jgi:hypothetical protein
LTSLENRLIYMLFTAPHFLSFSQLTFPVSRDRYIFLALLGKQNILRTLVENRWKNHWKTKPGW